MPKALVIVESPAKAKTIMKYLGKGYSVMASLGHVKDLPKKDLSVDVDNGFLPHYEVIEGKKKLVHELKQAAKGCDQIYLAADPDREGEAICYHLQEELKGKGKHAPEIYRVMFNEITANAVRRAFEKPLTVNVNLVEAQQARRVLDRLVGYKISPLLWDKVRRGLSAGRVQTVALRVIVEREREIRAFNKHIVKSRLAKRRDQSRQGIDNPGRIELDANHPGRVRQDMRNGNGQSFRGCAARRQRDSVARARGAVRIARVNENCGRLAMRYRKMPA